MRGLEGIEFVESELSIRLVSVLVPVPEPLMFELLIPGLLMSDPF